MNANTMHTLAGAYCNHRARIIPFHNQFNYLDLVQALDIAMDVYIHVWEVQGGVPEWLDFTYDSA